MAKQKRNNLTFSAIDFVFIWMVANSLFLYVFRTVEIGVNLH